MKRTVDYQLEVDKAKLTAQQIKKRLLVCLYVIEGRMGREIGRINK